MMTVLNFDQPFSVRQLADLARRLDTDEPHVIDIPVQIVTSRPLAAQAREFVDAVGWPAREWQTWSFVIRPPRLGIAALAIIAEIAGRCGYLPTIVTLRRRTASNPSIDEIWELVSLQGVADSAAAGHWPDQTRQ